MNCGDLSQLLNDLHHSGVDAQLEKDCVLMEREDGALRCVYHVTWWPVDRHVPMLLVNVFEDGRVVTDLDRIYQLLVPMGLAQELASLNIKGALTQGEHPVYGYPVFYIHPCQTREVLETISGSTEHLLYIWLQTYGQYIGLNLPPVKNE